MIGLGISFVSVGHRSQLKAYHKRLVTFDGRGKFQAQDLPHPPSSDQHLDSLADQNDSEDNNSGSGSSSSSKLQVSPIDVNVSVSPSNSVFGTSFPVLRMCFTQQKSLKNIVMHAIIFLLFVLSMINTVVLIITITSKAQLFQDTSASFVVQYLFFCVIIQAVVDATINAALAYVAARTRKNLTRGLEKA